MKKFVENKPHLYAFIEPKSEKEILNELEEQCKIFSGVRPGFDNWEDFLDFVFKIDKAIVILDEFQNFLKINPIVLAKIQKYWDKYEKNSHIFLITIGSYTGMIKKFLQTEKSRFLAEQIF